MKHKITSARYYTQYEDEVLANSRPKSMRVSVKQARRLDVGISLKDARELASTPLHVGSKKYAKNGLGVRDVMKACPWDKNRYGR